jgi:hypothetical protein
MLIANHALSLLNRWAKQSFKTTYVHGDGNGIGITFAINGRDEMVSIVPCVKHSYQTLRVTIPAILLYDRVVRVSQQVYTMIINGKLHTFEHNELSHTLTMYVIQETGDKAAAMIGVIKGSLCNIPASAWRDYEDEDIRNSSPNNRSE